MQLLQIDGGWVDPKQGWGASVGVWWLSVTCKKSLGKKFQKNRRGILGAANASAFTETLS